MSAEAGVQTAATGESEGIARATMVIALGNIASRVLGLVRESMLASFFGAGAAMDAFLIAIVIPRGLYDLLIGGHVNSALVPVMSAFAEREDRADLWQLVSALLTLFVVVMIALVLGIELLAGVIIDVVASDEAGAQTLQNATLLLRITAPALFFMSLFAILSSLLYALRRFTLPAFAAAVFNLGIVITTLLLEKPLGIRAVAYGWLVGSIAQLLLQWIGLHGLGLRLRVVWQHPGVRTIVLLYVPVMFSLALDVLINRPFSYNLASSTGEGSVSVMGYATTLVQFPHGLVATAISMAVLPTLSRQAGTLDTFKETLGKGLRLSISLILPATVGLMVLATPIIQLIFEHRVFTPTDTANTAFALRLYMVGLPFASLDLLLIFAFYARQDTLTPALVGLLSLVAYMVTAIFLLPYYSFFALMIADSVKHMIHAGVSGWLLVRRIGTFSGQQVIGTIVRALVAAVLMGIVGMVVLRILEAPLVNLSPFVREIIQVTGTGGICALFYLMLARLLGIGEIQLFFQQIRQRL